MIEPDQQPYFLVTGISPLGLTRRFACQEEAVAFARETADRSRLRLLVVRYDPAEPELLCTIVAEYSGELPF
jgi:hypothetical protein